MREKLNSNPRCPDRPRRACCWSSPASCFRRRHGWRRRRRRSGADRSDRCGRWHRCHRHRDRCHARRSGRRRRRRRGRSSRRRSDAAGAASPASIAGAAAAGSGHKPPTRPARPSSCWSSTTAASTTARRSLDPAGRWRSRRRPLRRPGDADLPATRAITLGVDVTRVPALIVMRPKRLSDGTPQATVNYGFQSRAEHRPGDARCLLQRPRSHLPPELSHERPRPVSRATCARSPTPAVRGPRLPMRRRRAGSPGPDPAAAPRPLARLHHRRPRRARLRDPEAVEARSRRRGSPAVSPESLLLEQGTIRRRAALTRDRRALRPRPRRPLRLPGRLRRRGALPGDHGAPLQGGAGRLRRPADAAGRHRRPGQRARRRRHPDRHRPRLPDRGRRRGRRRIAARPARHAAERRRRRDHRRSTTTEGGEEPDARRASARCRSAPRTRR